MARNRVSDASARASSVTARTMTMSLCIERTGNIVLFLFLCQDRVLAPFHHDWSFLNLWVAPFGFAANSGTTIGRRFQRELQSNWGRRQGGNNNETLNDIMRVCCGFGSDCDVSRWRVCSYVLHHENQLKRARHDDRSEAIFGWPEASGRFSRQQRVGQL
jgi:hypothetical protein